MSLIVVKKSRAVINIVSDTKLTYPEELFPDKSLAACSDGVIKVTILNPHLCIAFAGEVELAEEAIKVCRRSLFTGRDIREYLLNVNKTNLGKCEFIVCTGFPEYSVHVIKEMQITPANSAWIGSQNAFSVFQEKALEKRENTKNIESVLDDAMDYVLESGRAPEVKGFRVSVTNEGNFFHYKNYMATKIPPRSYSFGESQQFIIEVYGTAEEGGYSVSLFENGGRSDVVAIHVRQGEFGVLYKIREGGLLWPEVISSVDEHEFNDILFNRFGIQAQVAFSSLQKSYLRRGNKKFLKGDFTDAVELYTKGLKDSENSFRSALLFNRGLAFIKLNRLNEGYMDFSKAVENDISFEALVKKMLKY